MSEEVAGAIGGAAEGAATGFAIGGPVGGIVGGIIGGISGLLGGNKKKKARKYINQARTLERRQSYLDAGIQRRDMVRQARIARAQSLAASTAEGEGGLMSSGPMGALSSIGTQFNFNLGYFDSRISRLVQVQRLYDKAGKEWNAAQNIAGYTDALFSVASTFGGIKKATPSQIPTGGTVSSTPLGSNTYAGGNWSSFGGNLGAPFGG